MQVKGFPCLINRWYKGCTTVLKGLFIIVAKNAMSKIHFLDVPLYRCFASFYISIHAVIDQ